MRMQHRTAVIVSIFLIALFTLMLAGCGGGGGGGDGGVTSTNSAPILSNVSISPSEAAAGVTITIGGSFTFSDADGNLDGGTFNYTYENETYSFNLGSSFDGISNGTAGFTIDVVLSDATGGKSIPCWLIDGAGNQSNTFEVTFSQLWTRQLGTDLEDIGEALAVDSDNYIYVTGSTRGDLDGNINAGGDDVFLTKFNSTAAKEWTKLLGSTSADYAKGVAVDSNNNVYVTGLTYGGLFDGHVSAGGSDIFLAKFDSSGNKLWTQLLGTVEQEGAYGIAVDSSDNIYITGRTYGDLDGNINAGNWDIFLTKYNTSGNKIWTTLLGTLWSDSGYAVAVGSGDEVYVTGGTEGLLGNDWGTGGVLNNDVFLAKYDTSGNKQWVSQIFTNCTEWGFGVSVDSSGDAYVTGAIISCAFAGNVANGEYDAFLTKVDSSGVMQWIKQFGTGESDRGQAITVDKNNNVYVTGYLDSVYSVGSDDNTGGNVFLAQYSTLGDRLWIVEENRGYPWGDQGKGLAVDIDNNIYLTGMTHGQFDGHTNQNVGEDDVFILKYDANGTKL